MSTADGSLQQSPFQVKGLVYGGAQAYYAEHVPGGLPAVLKQLEDPGVRQFFEQRFNPSLQYDVLPLVPISAAAAKASGLTPEQLVVNNSQWMAHRDINGIFRILLKLSTPWLVASMLPKASLQYFNFGTAEGKMPDRTTLEAQQKGVPYLLAPWMIWAVTGFAPVALELAGAKNVTVTRADAIQKDGVVSNHVTCTLSWKITWT